METKSRRTATQAFPARRPEIVITPDNGGLFAVDCPELRWWFVVPEVGETAMFAHYDPPDWKLVLLAEMRTVRPATIHGVDGVEIRARQWEPESGSPNTMAIYGRLTAETSQWLAVATEDEAMRLRTFLDEGFGWDWGEMSRRIEDQGRFVRAADGSYAQAHSHEDLTACGAGVFSVSIGARTFRCLRVLELEGPVDGPGHRGVVEAYLTEAGRTVLMRRYAPEDRDGVALDQSTALVIDGHRFLLWYDCPTGIALGDTAVAG